MGWLKTTADSWRSAIIRFVYHFSSLVHVEAGSLEPYLYSQKSSEYACLSNVVRWGVVVYSIKATLFMIKCLIYTI